MLANRERKTVAEIRSPGLGRRLETLAFSLAGGLMLYAGARWPQPFGILVGIGFTVLLLPGLTQRWRSPLLGFLPGFALFAYWIHFPIARWGYVAWLLFVTLLGWHFVNLLLMTQLLHRTTHWPLYSTLPIAFGADEFLRGYLALGNVNMYGVSTFLYGSTRLIQISDAIGPIGLTALTCIPIGAGAQCLKVVIDRESGGPLRRSLRVLFATMMIPLLLMGYGSWRLAEERTSLGPKIAVIQPSLDHGRELTPQVLERQRQFTLRYVSRDAADLVAWPEYAILGFYEREPRYQVPVQALTRVLDTPLLFGTQSVAPGTTRPMCTALLVDRFGRIAGRTNKIALVPFTERFPFPALERYFPQLERWLRRVTLRAWGSAPDGVPGDRPQLMSLTAGGATWSFWSPLCYETCIPWTARDATQQGAHFFVNLTSESWLGWGFSNSMLGSAILRAVENRVGVVRVGNTGPSAFVTPGGALQSVLRGVERRRIYLEPGYLIDRVRVDSRRGTIYTRYGDWIDPLCLIVWCGVLFWKAAVMSWNRFRSRANVALGIIHIRSS